MKQIKSLLIVSLITLSLLGSYSCKEKECQDPTNPVCENYDPCYGKKATSAAFKMFETIQADPTIYPFFKPYETDTILSGSVLFEAEEKDDSTQYEWQIGAGIYKKRSFELGFTSLKAGQSVPITLIVKRAKVDKTCFPNDDGIDTITRILHKATSNRVIGYDRSEFTFDGFNIDEPNRTFKIQFFFKEIWEYPIVKGLIPGKDSFQIRQLEYLYRSLPMSTTDLLTLTGNVFISPNDSIRIDYRYSIGLSQMQTKTFIGKRVKP